ncbi:MAG: sugar ABC transporter permease [Clostridia bacterium]|nr:sugar ABC transporter permease [Clostridia bacterium]
MKAMTERKLRENLSAYLFVGPFVVLCALFIIYPIFRGFINSLYNTKWRATVYVGLQNYKTIFSNATSMLAIKNSLLFVATVVPLLIIFGIWISGSIFDKRRLYVSGVRAVLYIPVIASMVVMSIIWRFILDSQSGLVRYFCMLLGLKPVNVLADPTYTIYLLIFILFTMNIGQCVVLYTADMLSIPNDLLEACRIDGGGRLDMFRYILIPLTKNTTIFTFITQTASVFKVFIVIQLLTRGGPNYKTTTMMYLLYEYAFGNNINTGVASAMGVLMFVISLVLITLRFVFIRREKEAM